MIHMLISKRSFRPLWRHKVSKLRKAERLPKLYHDIRNGPTRKKNSVVPISIAVEPYLSTVNTLGRLKINLEGLPRVNNGPCNFLK